MTYDTTTDVVNVIMGIVSREDSLRKISQVDFDECRAVVQSVVDTECGKRLRLKNFANECIKNSGGKPNAQVDAPSGARSAE